MNARDLLNMQINLANTAHQREVADLQAAGLNPILSANGSGAATPNILSDGLISSSGSSGKSSAKAIKAAADGNPINKALGTTSKALDVISRISNDQALREIHPERYTAAEEAARKNQQNFWNQYARSQSNNSNVNTNVNQSSNNASSAPSNNNGAMSFFHTIQNIDNSLHPIRSRIGNWLHDNMSGSTMESLGDIIGIFNYKLGNAIKKVGRAKKNEENR